MTLNIFNYTRRHIIKVFISVIQEDVDVYIVSYETIYIHNNIYFLLYKMREYIMTINISIIHESVFLIIRDDI